MTLNGYETPGLSFLAPSASGRRLRADAASFRMPSSNSGAQTIRRTKADDAKTLRVLKDQIQR
jgi:hypothetical protein